MDSISIVIPAYNESARIGSSLVKISQFCKKQGFDYEIIVVDDGSSDNTRDIVRSQEDKNIYLLSYGANRGKGFAVRTGILASKKDLILFSDADLSTPIEELLKFLNHDSDVIIASRNLEESRIAIKQPKIRQTLGQAFPMLVEFILPLGIKDTQCGFKLFKKDAANRIFRNLKTQRFGFDVEALFLAKKYGFKVLELPVEWHNAKGSKVSLIRDVPRMFSDVLKIRMRDLRGIYR